MALCFIEPQDAIRVIAESVGREARRQLLGEVVRAWVDEIPEHELQTHYVKAVADLDEHDLSMLAAWHASLEVGHPIANREFLVSAFGQLGENRREALKIARDEMSADPLQPWWYVAVERVTRSWAPPKTIARWEARENRWHQTVDD